MKLLSFVALFCCISLAQIAGGMEEVLTNHLVPCLTKNGLDLSIFGVSKIEDIQDFASLQSVDKQKRSCFVACMFEKKGVIKPDGTLIEHPQPADPTKKFATTFEDAINACRVPMSLCDLGNCLYEVYF